MEYDEKVRLLKTYSLHKYHMWCKGNAYDPTCNGEPFLTGLSVKELLKLLDTIFGRIPQAVNYDLIYSACAVLICFPHLQAGMESFPRLDLDRVRILFRCARFLLNVGCDRECIEFCDFCLQKQNETSLTLEMHIEVLFARSKAYRNLGEYQYALDDLREALCVVNDNGDISYLMGAVLVRIGKVYSQFLMMMSVSLCFLNEAEEQLKKWLDSEDEHIRERAAIEYAICLDAIGQYWKGKDHIDDAIEYFKRAKEINDDIGRVAGVFRTQSHIIITEYPRLLGQGQCRDELLDRIQTLKYIVRKLKDDPANQRGVAIRLLHLAEIEAQSGPTQMENALNTVNACRENALLFQDAKTLIKLKISELKFKIYNDVISQKDLREVMELAANRKCFGYEIKLNDAVIEAIQRKAIGGADLLNVLSRNRTLYLHLSNVAQSTIRKISTATIDEKDEFSYLSDKNSRNLLVGVVSDYDVFIKKMNEIIDQLLKITDQRSKDLNKAIIAEAKASLASGILHDLKHILTTEAGTTCLDSVEKDLEQWGETLSPQQRDALLNPIRLVNRNLKGKILPKIQEATRVPNDFNYEINIMDVFSEVSKMQLNERLDKEESLDGASKVHVELDCPDKLTIIYNQRIFTNLIKEMFRNALDYQKACNAKVTKYIMQAKDNMGEVEIAILTQFKDEVQAEQATEAISGQLSGRDGREDGYGIRLLRGFMQSKTGGASVASEYRSKDIAGIRFSIPKKRGV